MQPLDKTLLEIKRRKEIELNEIDDKIKERIDFIYDKACDFFGQKHRCWSFIGSRDYNDSWRECTFNDALDEEWISLRGDWNISMKIILNDKFIDLNNKLPLRWLFEDFEKELLEGIEKNNVFNLAQKELKLKKQQEKLIQQQNLAASIKAKLNLANLTPEELAFLKIKD